MNIAPWFELTSSKNKAALMAALPSWAWCGDPYVTVAAETPTAYKLLDFPCRPGLKIRPALGPLEEGGTWNKLNQAAHDIPQRTYPVLLDFEYAWKGAFPLHPVSDKVWWKRVKANMATLPGARQYLVYPSTVSGDPAIAECQRRFLELMMTQLDAAPVYCNQDCPRTSMSSEAQAGFEMDRFAAFNRKRYGPFKINVDSTGDPKQGWPDADLRHAFFYTRGAPVILWVPFRDWGRGEEVHKAIWP